MLQACRSRRPSSTARAKTSAEWLQDAGLPWTDSRLAARRAWRRSFQPSDHGRATSTCSSSRILVDDKIHAALDQPVLDDHPAAAGRKSCKFGGQRSAGDGGPGRSKRTVPPTRLPGAAHGQERRRRRPREDLRGDRQRRERRHGNLACRSRTRSSSRDAVLSARRPEVQTENRLKIQIKIQDDDVWQTRSRGRPADERRGSRLTVTTATSLRKLSRLRASAADAVDAKGDSQAEVSRRKEEEEIDDSA